MSIARRLDTDEKLAFVDVSALPDDTTVERGLTAGNAMKRFHVRTSDGEIVSGAAAFLEMWGATPRLKWVRRFRSSSWLVALLDVVYSVFLRVRPTISRWLRRRDARGSG